MTSRSMECGHKRTVMALCAHLKLLLLGLGCRQRYQQRAIKQQSVPPGDEREATHIFDRYDSADCSTGARWLQSIRYKIVDAG